MYLIQISHVDYREIFKICLEYWNFLTADLYRENPIPWASKGLMLSDGNSSPRRNMYKEVLSEVCTPCANVHCVCTFICGCTLCTGPVQLYNYCSQHSHTCECRCFVLAVYMCIIICTYICIRAYMHTYLHMCTHMYVCVCAYHSKCSMYPAIHVFFVYCAFM